MVYQENEIQHAAGAGGHVTYGPDSRGMRRSGNRVDNPTAADHNPCAYQCADSDAYACADRGTYASTHGHTAANADH